MKSTRIFQSFNEISEEYLNEAELWAARRKKRARILRVLLPAAALAALLSIALLAALPLMQAGNEAPESTDFAPAQRNDEIDAISGVVDPTTSSPVMSSMLVTPTFTRKPETPERTAIDDLIFDKYEDHVEITDYVGESDTIVLPDAIDDLPITKVEISEKTADTVTAIRFNDDGFEDVVVPKAKAIKLTIGKDVTRVDEALLHNAGVDAFEVESGNQYYASFCGMLYNKNCTTLIACPAGLTTPVVEYHPNNQYVTGRYTSYLAAQLQTISERAFSGCASLRSITLPEHVTTIGRRAFSGCSSLRTLVLPGSLTSIEGSAFEFCSSLSYLRYHGDYAGFSALKTAELKLPETVGVYYDLVGSADEETTAAIVSFFEEAEDAAALLTRFAQVSCTNETNANGAYLVSAEGPSCKSDFEKLLGRYFDEALCGRLIERGFDDYFEETNGQLYAYKKNIPAAYGEDRDTREYAVTKTANGCALTVRLTVPLLKTLAYVECRYELTEENGSYRLTGSYTLPAQAWYGLYLIESAL